MISTVPPDRSDYGFRFNRGIPARALMLDLAETDSNRLRKQSRLTLTCGDVPTFLIKVLRKRGVEVHSVSTVERAVAACQGTTYDVLIFDPLTPGFAAFVRMLKHGEPASAFAVQVEDPAALAHRTAVELAAEWVVQEEALTIRRWFEQLGESVITMLRQRFEYVPIFVIKPTSPDEYSVLIRPPGAAYVEKASKVPLEVAVLRLDARAMFTAMGPLA
jgi:hypothetical protein